MANDVMLLGGQTAIVETKRMNYELTAPSGVKTTLKRDVDFGVIPKTKKPSLYKSGAEKICFAYGLMHIISPVQYGMPRNTIAIAKAKSKR